jgi:hypothetical protein
VLATVATETRARNQSDSSLPSKRGTGTTPGDLQLDGHHERDETRAQRRGRPEEATVEAARRRLSARYTPTYLHDASSDFCDPFGFCQDWLHQFELTAAVVVRF